MRDAVDEWWVYLAAVARAEATLAKCMPYNELKCCSRMDDIFSSELPMPIPFVARVFAGVAQASGIDDDLQLNQQRTASASSA